MYSMSSSRLSSIESGSNILSMSIAKESFGLLVFGLGNSLSGLEETGISGSTENMSSFKIYKMSFSN